MMSLKSLSFYNLGDMVGSSGGYLNIVGNLIELAGNAIRDVLLMLPDNNINFKSRDSAVLWWWNLSCDRGRQPSRTKSFLLVYIWYKFGIMI